MGKENGVIHIIGEPLSLPDTISRMCEDTSITSSRLDAYYRQWFEQLIEEVADNGESTQAKIIALSLQEVQAEVRGIHKTIEGIKRLGTLKGNGNES